MILKRLTYFIFEYMPIALAANQSVLKAMYAWGYTFSLLSLQIRVAGAINDAR